MPDYNGYVTGRPTDLAYTPVLLDPTVARDLHSRNCEQCGNCGAIVPHSRRTQHSNFHKTFSNRKDQTMGRVAWCDPGNHAFKDGEPGSLHFEGSTVDGDGKHVNESMDACREHNPMRARPEVIVRELENEFPVNGGVTD